MEFVFLLGVVCFIFFLLVISHLFADTADESNLSWKQRFWVVVNLLVWAYEFFFLAVILGGIKGLNVHFGGGLGDLLYTILLTGMVLLHIISLTVFAYKRLRILFFLILVCLPINLLIMMHLDAARGNEENGYMTGGNCTGLYYDAKANWQREKCQQELEEAKSDSVTELDWFLHSAERGY